MSTTSLQRILVPTDLSDFAAGAIRWAALLQRRLGGRITVLYANQPWVPFDIMEGPAAYVLQTSVEFRDRIARDLRAYVERDLPDAGDAVESRIVEQAPARAILETADAIDADLIVMGTHGRTGWRRALLGSVAEKVVHHTDRAALCIPPDAKPSIGKILCRPAFARAAAKSLTSVLRLCLIGTCARVMNGCERSPPTRSTRERDRRVSAPRAECRERERATRESDPWIHACVHATRESDPWDTFMRTRVG